MSDRGSAEDTAEDDVDIRGDRDPVEFGSATPPAEWALAIVGALLALGMIGLLVAGAVGAPDTAPALSARVLGVQAGGEGHLVEAEVRNDGGIAAWSVLVEGRLTVDGAVVERSQVTVDYLPSGGSRAVGLVFEEDPGSGSVDVVPLGFTQ